MMRRLLSSLLLTICGATAFAQSQKMIYADLSMTKADTVSVDLSSTCPEYRKIVLSDQEGRPLNFPTLQSAVNHLARYGWKVTTRSATSVTMEYPYTVGIVYGAQGLKTLEETLTPRPKD